MKNLVLLILVVFIAISCNKKVKEQTTMSLENKSSITNDELIMYTPSELAALMQSIYDVNLDWKKEILKGNIPRSFPEKYKTIHSAKSDNENADSPFYKAMATTYLMTVENVTKANPDNVVERFNAVVNVCVSCHQEVCPGPIERIEKLRIGVD